MSENSGWVKYAVVGIIVVIAIVAALILLGIVELPERGGGGAVGTTQQQPQSNPFFGFIPVAIVAIIALFLVKFLHKKKEEPHEEPDEGIKFKINPPEITFEFGGPKTKKVGFGIYNYSKEEMRNVQLASYPSVDHEIRNTPSSQFISIPKNGHAEGFFEVESTVPDKDWEAKEKTVQIYASYINSKGQKRSTNFDELTLKWKAKKEEEPLLDLHVATTSSILKEDSPTATFGFTIKNNGIDDVKNCVLIVAPASDIVEIERDGYFPISRIEGGGKDYMGSFKVKPVQPLDSLTEEKEVDIVIAVFKSADPGSEKISNIVVKSVVLLPKIIKEEITDIELEVADPIVRFSKENKERAVSFTIRNRGGKKAACSLGIFEKEGKVKQVNAKPPSKLASIGTIPEKKNIVFTARLAAVEPWEGEHPLLAVLIIDTEEGKKVASNRVQLRAIWTGKKEDEIPPPEDEIDKNVQLIIPNTEGTYTKNLAFAPFPFSVTNNNEYEITDCKVIIEPENPLLYQPVYDATSTIKVVRPKSPESAGFAIASQVKEDLFKPMAVDVKAYLSFIGKGKRKKTDTVDLTLKWAEFGKEVVFVLAKSKLTFTKDNPTQNVGYTVINNLDEEIKRCTIEIRPVAANLYELDILSAHVAKSIMPGDPPKPGELKLNSRVDIDTTVEFTKKAEILMSYYTPDRRKRYTKVVPVEIEWKKSVSPPPEPEPEKSYKIVIRGKVIAENAPSANEEKIEGASVSAYNVENNQRIKQTRCDAKGMYELEIESKVPKLNLKLIARPRVEDDHKFERPVGVDRAMAVRQGTFESSKSPYVEIDFAFTLRGRTKIKIPVPDYLPPGSYLFSNRDKALRAYKSSISRVRKGISINEIVDKLGVDASVDEIEKRVSDAIFGTTQFKVIYWSFVEPELTELLAIVVNKIREEGRDVLIITTPQKELLHELHTAGFWTVEYIDEKDQKYIET